MRFAASALQTLVRYPWPGNVRELCNLVERMAILYPHSRSARQRPAGALSRRALAEEPSGAACWPMMDARPSWPHGRWPSNDADACCREGGIDLKDHLADIEVGLIRQALDATGGVVAHAAKLLHMQRTTLVEKLRKYGLQNGLAA